MAYLHLFNHPVHLIFFLGIRKGVTFLRSSMMMSEPNPYSRWDAKLVWKRQSFFPSNRTQHQIFARPNQQFPVIGSRDTCTQLSLRTSTIYKLGIMPKIPNLHHFIEVNRCKKRFVHVLWYTMASAQVILK